MSVAEFYVENNIQPGDQAAFDRVVADSQKACYNCGETGHISRNCQNEKVEGADKGKARRESRRKCFNCGERGHISVNCPDAGKGPKCYNCGNFGHISSACTEPDNRG